jgi:glycerol-3-phosphate dehydrogenase subunit C
VSAATGGGAGEGNLEAPTRHPLNWRDASFYDEASLEKELQRVFDICHGCRRCFSLCQSFPTLFDAIDASPTLELDGVDKKVYWQVVEHCYLCDLCYMTKCPYVPPHPWNVDFPHLMLRAKAVRAKKGELSWRQKVLSSTDAVGSIVGIPVVAEIANAANRNPLARKLLDKTLGVHPTAPLPDYHFNTARKRLTRSLRRDLTVTSTPHTRGQVVLFTTCYGNRNEPELAQDLACCFRAQRHCRSRWRPRSAAAACRNSSWAIWKRSRNTRTRTFRSCCSCGGWLRHRGADSLVRADVQAGIATDVR